MIVYRFIQESSY